MRRNTNHKNICSLGIYPSYLSTRFMFINRLRKGLAKCLDIKNAITAPTVQPHTLYSAVRNGPIIIDVAGARGSPANGANTVVAITTRRYVILTVALLSPNNPSTYPRGISKKNERVRIKTKSTKIVSTTIGKLFLLIVHLVSELLSKRMHSCDNQCPNESGNKTVYSKSFYKR